MLDNNKKSLGKKTAKLSLKKPERPFEVENFFFWFTVDVSIEILQKHIIYR